MFSAIALCEVLHLSFYRNFIKTRLNPNAKSQPFRVSGAGAERSIRTKARKTTPESSGCAWPISFLDCVVCVAIALDREFISHLFPPNSLLRRLLGNDRSRNSGEVHRATQLERFPDFPFSVSVFDFSRFLADFAFEFMTFSCRLAI